MLGPKYFPQQWSYEPTLRSAMDLCFGSFLEEPFCVSLVDRMCHRGHIPLKTQASQRIISVLCFVARGDLNTRQCLKHKLQALWALQNHFQVTFKSQHAKEKAYSCTSGVWWVQVCATRESGNSTPLAFPHRWCLSRCLSCLVGSGCFSRGGQWIRGQIGSMTPELSTMHIHVGSRLFF